jgi:hypothetical protein
MSSTIFGSYREILNTFFDRAAGTLKGSWVVVGGMRYHGHAWRVYVGDEEGNCLEEIVFPTREGREAYFLSTPEGWGDYFYALEGWDGFLEALDSALEDRGMSVCECVVGGEGDPVESHPQMMR